MESSSTSSGYEYVVHHTNNIESKTDREAANSYSSEDVNGDDIHVGDLSNLGKVSLGEYYKHDHELCAAKSEEDLSQTTPSSENYASISNNHAKSDVVYKQAATNDNVDDNNASHVHIHESVNVIPFTSTTEPSIECVSLLNKNKSIPTLYEGPIDNFEHILHYQRCEKYSNCSNNHNDNGNNDENHYYHYGNHNDDNDYHHDEDNEEQNEDFGSGSGRNNSSFKSSRRKDEIVETENADRDSFHSHVMETSTVVEVEKQSKIGEGGNNDFNFIDDATSVSTSKATANIAHRSNKHIYSALVEGIFTDLKDDSLLYLESHHEIMSLIDELLADVMFQKPHNVPKFAEKFFRSKRDSLVGKKMKFKTDPLKKIEEKRPCVDGSRGADSKDTTSITTTVNPNSIKNATLVTNAKGSKQDSFLDRVYRVVNNSITPELQLILLGALSSAIAGIFHNKFFGSREQVHCSHTVHHNQS